MFICDKIHRIERLLPKITQEHNWLEHNYVAAKYRCFTLRDAQQLCILVLIKRKKIVSIKQRVKLNIVIVLFLSLPYSFYHLNY